MRDFLTAMTCGRLRHSSASSAASSSASTLATTESNLPTTSRSSEPRPEVQSIYEVESLRPISIHFERLGEPLGSWHSDLVSILLDLGKEPGQSSSRSLYYHSSRRPEHNNTATMSSSTVPSEDGPNHHHSEDPSPGPLITGLHHINITVPDHTLPLAKAFYADTLGLTPRPVPVAQAQKLLWFDIGASGQQVHISLPEHPDDVASFRATDTNRHPCFRVGSPAALLELQKRVYGHWLRGGDGAPLAADAVGETSGPTTKEYPKRFFARDFAGNRLEFTL